MYAKDATNQMKTVHDGIKQARQATKGAKQTHTEGMSKACETW